MTERERAIAASVLFRGVDLSRCAPFAPIAVERSFPRGAALFRLGEHAGMLFIVRSGIVQLTMPLATPIGERDVVIQEAQEHDVLAWSSLIEPYRYTMGARAATDVTLLGFPTTDLQEALAAYPAAGLTVLTNLARVIARRLQVMQAMWTRELQRNVSMQFS